MPTLKERFERAMQDGRQDVKRKPSKDKDVPETLTDRFKRAMEKGRQDVNSEFERVEPQGSDKEKFQETFEDNQERQTKGVAPIVNTSEPGKTESKGVSPIKDTANPGKAANIPTTELKKLSKQDRDKITFDAQQKSAMDKLLNPAFYAAQEALQGTGLPVPEEYEPQGEVQEQIGHAARAGGTALGTLGVGKAASAVGRGAKSAYQTGKELTENLPSWAKALGLGGAAVTGEEVTRGAVSPEAENNLLQETGQSLRAGTGDLVKTAGNVAEWQGLEGAGEKMQQAGEDIKEGYQQDPVEFSWKSLLNPHFYSRNVAQTAPMTAALIPAMYAGYKGTGKALSRTALSPFKKAIIQSLGGATLSRPIESALEAGATYDEAKAKGMSEQEADRAAQETFNKNLALSGLDAAQLATAFAPSPIKATGKLGKAVTATGRVAGTAGTEAGEEGVQEVIQRQAMDEDVSFDKQMQEAMAIGGIFGGAMGSAGVLTDTIRQRAEKNLPGDLKKNYDRQVEKNKEIGLENPEEKAMNEIATSEQGQEVVRKATLNTIDDYLKGEIKKGDTVTGPGNKKLTVTEVGDEKVKVKTDKGTERTISKKFVKTDKGFVPKVPADVMKDTTQETQETTATQETIQQSETTGKTPQKQQVAKPAEINQGDTVYSPDNQRLTVTDTSDPDSLRVKNDEGTEFSIRREKIKTTKPAEKPSGQTQKSLQERNDIKSVDEIQTGDKVFVDKLNKYADVVKKNQKTVRVKDEQGNELRVPIKGLKWLSQEELDKASEMDKPVSQEIESLRETEEMLGERVDETIGEVTPKVGLSIRKTGKTKGKGQRYTFADEETERRWQEAKGLPKEPVANRAQGLTSKLWRQITREFEHLPRTQHYSKLRFELSRLQKQKDVSNIKTLKNIQGILVKLDNNQYDLFSRKVILDDLMEEYELGHNLPFGFTPEQLKKEHKRFTELVKNDSEVQEAVNLRRRLWDEIRENYKNEMKAIGFDVSKRLQKKNYFRHQIIDKANVNRAKSTRKLKTPTNRAHLKERKGSSLDINTDYLQAEFEVMSTILYDIEVAKTIQVVDENYNIAEQLKKQAKEQNKKLDDIIPEGYVKWQPREGSVFFKSLSVSEDVATQAVMGQAEEMNISKDQLREVLAKGTKFREFVVEDRIAETLDNLSSMPPGENVAAEVAQKIQRSWKVWVLVSPKRYFKYNLRNMTGDADAAFAGNPSTFKKMPQAVKELYDVYFGDKAMTKNMKDWFERGGMSTLLQVQELEDVNQLKIFVDQMQAQGTWKEIPMKTWQNYWKWARLSTDFREAILRYAAYLDFLEQMQNSKNGMPKNFGASIPEEVRGLDDIKDRAFKLSNELLGAYDQIGVIGQSLRRYIIPFWSWNEVNFRRYKQLILNAARDEQLAHTAGKWFISKTLKTTVKSPLIAIRVGKLLLMATGMWIMFQTWNELRYPELEKNLPKYVKEQPHIIFGQDNEGNTIYFSRTGAFADALEWFGVNYEIISDLRELMDGDKTFKEIASDMVKKPANKLYQSIGPMIKSPFEAALGKSTFPDVFKPGTIRDRGLYVARNLGLESEYRKLKGLPSKPYNKTLKDIFVYSSNPRETAYYEIIDKKHKFRKDELKEGGEGSFQSPRSDALYNFKKALRYEDKEAARRYLEEYVQLGGTGRGLKQSLKAWHPLYGLNEEEKQAFIKTLDKDELQKLKTAIKFYEDNYSIE